MIHEFAVGVDRDTKTVTLGSGATLAYDRLVVSPGIDFVEGSVPGWSLAHQDVMPHAYKGGTQVALLKSQIAAMPQGGTFAMIAPPNPYRCPPGPYERISMVAWHLKQTEQPDRQDPPCRPEGDLLEAGSLGRRLARPLPRHDRTRGP